MLTHNPSYEVEGAVVVHSLDELHKELEKYNSEDIYIIGGQKIYEQLVDECDVAHITKVDFEYDADAYFPNLDEKPEWQITGDVYKRQEINCVSETLAPTMLQFLQCKTFGNQAVPKGWVIVAAGNPDRKSTRLNSSHLKLSRMPSSA